jgi:antitoxin PrlF
MSKILQAASTLTDRYQTTIPEPVRELLHLNKRDKITYTIEENGKVLISRASEDDPLLGDFLAFLTNDIRNNPSHIRSISPTLIDRARSLVSGVEIDLDAPLDDKDE